MSSFVFKNSKGEEFTVTGPEGMTIDQAEAIWKQQTDTGSLTGLSVGSALSAASQLAKGLPGAAAMLSQATSAAKGFLPPGTNLNSITSLMGPGGAAAATQVSTALSGASAAYNSLTTGATASAVSIPGIVSTVGTLTGASAQATSFSSQTVSKVSDAVSGVATNGINFSDFAKQGSATSGIDGMSLPDVSGVMASASKLVGQGFDKVTDTLGAGKFGMDPKQLERAGLIKPGSAASFLASGATNIAAMLKSPKVWTGKDGASSLDSFLSNPALQDKTQQGLMKQGLGELKQLGVPVDSLNPTAIAGLANNAAKSVGNTVDWLKNSPSLPSGVKSAFDSVAAAGSYAVSFVNGKLEPPMVKEAIPEPAVGTVNAETVTAAANRIVGNSKVPPVLAT